MLVKSRIVGMSAARKVRPAAGNTGRSHHIQPPPSTLPVRQIGSHRQPHLEDIAVQDQNTYGHQYE